MSRYIELHNFIKKHAELNWLTPSQQQAFDALQNVRRLYHVINLYGAPGSGKTFLGWICHRESIGTYLPSPRPLQHDIPSLSSSCLIIDNIQTHRAAFRHLLKEIQIYSVPTLIVISRDPIKEEIAAIELRCTQQDVEQVQRNLEVDAQLPEGIHDPNLWQIFYLKCGVSIIEWDNQRR